MPVEETKKYIRIRVRMPGEFRDDTIKTVWLSKPKGINSLQGKLKSPPEGREDSMVVQSLLFVKEKWTRERALAWAREHDYKPKAIGEVEMKGDEIMAITEIEEVESKSDGAPEMEHKAYVGEIKDIDENERTITAFISTEALDRQNDVMVASGAQLSNYKRNPVVLWAHQYATPPIGRNLWIKRPKDKPGLLAKTQFANTEFADEIFQLYKEQFLNAWSVGFVPLETKDAEDGGNGRRIEKWDLLEYSAVPVPANPEALQLAYQKGIIGDTLAKELGVEVEEKQELKGGYLSPEGFPITLREIAKRLNPQLSYEQIDKLIEKIATKPQSKQQPKKDEPPKKKSKGLTGEELKAIKQTVIAGVRSWLMGIVQSEKEGFTDGQRKTGGDTGG